MHDEQGAVQLRCVKFLLEQRGAQVNQQDKREGWTALHRCARMAHHTHAPYLEIFEYLLQHGADPNATTFGTDRQVSSQSALCTRLVIACTGDLKWDHIFGLWPTTARRQAVLVDVQVILDKSCSFRSVHASFNKSVDHVKTVHGSRITSSFDLVLSISVPSVILQQAWNGHFCTYLRLCIGVLVVSSGLD